LKANLKLCSVLLLLLLLVGCKQSTRPTLPPTAGTTPNGNEALPDPDKGLTDMNEINNTGSPAISTPTMTFTAAGDMAPTSEALTSTPKPHPPASTPTSESSLTPTPARTALAITSFTLDIEDLPDNGKRITFNWTTTGAEYVLLRPGTDMMFRYLEWGKQPANGSFTHDFLYTHYVNPSMHLVAKASDGAEVVQEIAVTWSCRYPSFFQKHSSIVCAAAPASESAAAEQSFEHGRMIWLQEITEYADQAPTGSHLLVFYDDGAFARYDDTWAEGQPESDPALTPPTGLQQPIRGFGKLWRENPDVHERLGWAVNTEVGFTSMWQPEYGYAKGPRYAYVKTADGRVLEVTWERYSYSAARWHEVSPP